VVRSADRRPRPGRVSRRCGDAAGHGVQCSDLPPGHGGECSRMWRRR
jgi:hypothetical protein